MWIAGSCDHDLEVVNLSDHHVVALPRNGDIPARLAGNLYYRGNLDEALVAAARAEAATLAQVLGATVVGAVGVAQWYFADPALDQFGEPVPPEIISNSARMRVQDSAALVGLLDAGWTFAERVQRADLAAWIEEKETGRAEIAVVFLSKRMREGIATLLSGRLPTI